MGTGARRPSVPIYSLSPAGAGRPGNGPRRTAPHDPTPPRAESDAPAILTALLDDPRRAEGVPAEALPGVLIRLAAVQSALSARLAVNGKIHPSATVSYLTIEEASARLKVPADTVYRRWRRAPNARKFGREIRIPEEELGLLGTATRGR